MRGQAEGFACLTPELLSCGRCRCLPVAGSLRGLYLLVLFNGDQVLPPGVPWGNGLARERSRRMPAEGPAATSSVVCQIGSGWG